MQRIATPGTSSRNHQNWQYLTNPYHHQIPASHLTNHSLGSDYWVPQCFRWDLSLQNIASVCSSTTMLGMNDIGSSQSIDSWNVYIWFHSHKWHARFMGIIQILPVYLTGIAAHVTFCVICKKSEQLQTVLREIGYYPLQVIWPHTVWTGTFKSVVATRVSAYGKLITWKCPELVTSRPH